MRGDIVPPKRPETATPRPRRSRSNPSADTAPVVEPIEPAEATPPTNDRITPLPEIQLDDMPPTTSDEKAHRRPSLRFPPVKVLAAVALALILGGIIALLAWYSHQLSAVAAKSDEKVMVTIEPGMGLSDIAASLKQNDLIRNELVFEWYVRQNGKTSRLQSGSYRLAKAEDVPAIVHHLTSGNADTFSITFLPGATLARHKQALLDVGYSAEQIDAAFAKKYDHPIFEGKPAESDLEGYIYGETYSFSANATVEEILLRSFDQFEDVVADNNLVSLYKQQGFSLYQGITLASIIQREVASPSDAAQVAQVFKTRYDKGMQLGSDVTYQYIADKTGQARSVDIASPYNTRRYVGLPPGPISSPGIAALKAVGSPAPGDYIYFLSGDDDKTYFAHTNEEHERNIREHCQKKCQII